MHRKAIRTFIDEEFERGNEITPGLLTTIEESKASIIIFSPDFASSPWCLDEVVKIIECHEIQGQIVIPVFFDVDPSDVDPLGKPSGIFARAISEHEKCSMVQTDRVQRWKEALKRATNLAGWDSHVIR